jgi:GNAT superfamily N-acetyltransferase
MTDINMKPENLARLVCRPALPMDTRDVMEFTKKIWDGDDYIPMVWDMWLKDEDGLLAAAEKGGRVIGVSKLSKLSAEDWWMEGLRVDPEFERRGIASHLHKYMMETWSRIGGGALRLVTSSKREAVHHLCRKTGFRKTCEFSAYGAPALLESGDKFELVAESEIDQAFELIRNSPVLELSCGLVDQYWSWGKPQRSIIVEALERGLAWWWNDRRGLLLYWEDRHKDQDERYIKLQALACPLEDLVACLQDIRRLCHRLGIPKVEWTASTHEDLTAALLSSGFENLWESTLYLFELDHTS